MKKPIVLVFAIALYAFALAQDKPTQIAKKDLPAKAPCVVCTSGGENHGDEKPAAGSMYKGKAYYFCNSKEVALFAKDPEAFLPSVLPRAMAEFTISDTTGKLWNAESMKDKVVLIDYWATWCGPCIQMMPALDKVALKYKDSPFVLLSVSVDKDKPAFDKFLKSHKFPNPVLHDTTQTFAKWGVKTIPATFLIKNGQVVGQWSGVQSEKTLSAAIDVALKN